MEQNATGGNVGDENGKGTTGPNMWNKKKAKKLYIKWSSVWAK